MNFERQKGAFFDKLKDRGDHMKILVGLSGGVDSAVAAYLLQKQGHEVVGGFMRNWDAFTNNDIKGNPTISNDTCPQEKDYQDALEVAQKLGIPLLRQDYVKEYWNHVFQTFISEYQKGRTPNPDILCNRYIKFDSFFQFAMEQGFDAVATGHYASTQIINNRQYLSKAKDQNKDQTYFLCQIDQEHLQKVIFPLGKLEKKEVRQIAQELKLESVATKKDSTGICFIGERNFRQFLSNYIPNQVGDIIDIQNGKILGQHEGCLYYTTGQRKGLNITAFEGPWFVVDKEVEKNHVIVTHHTHQEWLITDSCLVTDMCWLVAQDYPLPKKLTAKFRYRQKDQEVELEIIDPKTIKLHYPQGIPNVTCGQEAVLYHNDLCLGGGVIDVTYYQNENQHQRIIKQCYGNY